MTGELPAEVRADVEVLWNFHRVDDPPQPADVAVGLGSHEPSAAFHAAELYHRGLFPLVVFTGGKRPATAKRFPRGEAVHFAEIAEERGVPRERILLETRARHTGENLTFTRQLLADRGIGVDSVLLVSRPHHQRRARATARKVWPEVRVRTSACRRDLDQYLADVGADRLVHIIVGETQRLTVYAEAGFAVAQEIPDEVRGAYERLVAAGYTRRLVPDPGVHSGR
jgi:uncharacterized SAM-binding protein YcdF (DUF218 family)